MMVRTYSSLPAHYKIEVEATVIMLNGWSASEDVIIRIDSV